MDKEAIELQKRLIHYIETEKRTRQFIDYLQSISRETSITTLIRQFEDYQQDIIPGFKEASIGTNQNLREIILDHLIRAFNSWKNDPERHIFRRWNLSKDGSPEIFFFRIPLHMSHLPKETSTHTLTQDHFAFLNLVFTSDREQARAEALIEFLQTNPAAQQMFDGFEDQIKSSRE